MTWDAPAAPDGPGNSRHSGTSSAPELLDALAKALQVLIHAQAQQAGQLAELAVAMQNLTAAIHALIASDLGEEPTDDATPDVGLDGQPIVRR